MKKQLFILLSVSLLLFSPNLVLSDCLELRGFTSWKVEGDHTILLYKQNAPIAKVNLKGCAAEEQARKDYEILVGKTKYSNTVRGEAMMEEGGFAKAIVEKGTQRILGFHMIGPEASTLIQEVVNVMANEESVDLNVA